MITSYEEALKAKDAIILEKDEVIIALAKALSAKIAKETEPETQEDNLPSGTETAEAAAAVTVEAQPPEILADKPVEKTAEVVTPPAETIAETTTVVDPVVETVSTTKEAGNGAVAPPDNSQPPSASKTDVAPGNTIITDGVQAGQGTPEVAPPQGEDGKGIADTTGQNSTESVREILVKGRFARILSETSKSRGIHRNPLTVVNSTK